jgi:hypothetical protein
VVIENEICILDDHFFYMFVNVDDIVLLVVAKYEPPSLHLVLKRA